MKSVSVAIATSISSIFNFFILYHNLKKSTLNIFERDNFSKYFRISFCSILAALITVFVGYLINDQSVLFLLSKAFILPKSLMFKLNSFFVLFAIYFVSLFSLAYIFKVSEILDIISKRLAKK
jgi:peptidoglycan biosynthesis protein MviN/MurJ (putative lipid II flippase)